MATILVDRAGSSDIAVEADSASGDVGGAGQIVTASDSHSRGAEIQRARSADAGPSVQVVGNASVASKGQRRPRRYRQGTGVSAADTKIERATIGINGTGVGERNANGGGEGARDAVEGAGVIEGTGGMSEFTITGEVESGPCLIVKCPASINKKRTSRATNEGSRAARRIVESSLQILGISASNIDVATGCGAPRPPHVAVGPSEETGDG